METVTQKRIDSKRVSSLTDTQRRIYGIKGTFLTSLTEATLPGASLVIHHYRYIDRDDVHRKCSVSGEGHSAGYHTLPPEQCEAALMGAWHPDLFDRTMVNKIELRDKHQQKLLDVK